MTLNASLQLWRSFRPVCYWRYIFFCHCKISFIFGIQVAIMQLFNSSVWLFIVVPMYFFFHRGGSSNTSLMSWHFDSWKASISVTYLLKLVLRKALALFKVFTWYMHLSCWLNPHPPLFFKLQASGGNSSSPSSPAAATPPAISEGTPPSAAKPSPSDAHPASEAKPQPLAPSPSQPQPQPSPAPAEDPSKDSATTPGATTAGPPATVSDRHSPAAPQPARTPGSEDIRSETSERTEGMPEWASKRMTDFSWWYSFYFAICNTFVFIASSSQVKKSTLNPNAKEFNPIKPQMPMVSQCITVKSW